MQSMAQNYGMVLIILLQSYIGFDIDIQVQTRIGFSSPGARWVWNAPTPASPVSGPAAL